MALSIGKVTALLELRDQFSSQIAIATANIDKLATKAARLGDSMQAAGAKMSAGFTLPIVGAASGATVAFLSFEQSMKRAQAAMADGTKSAAQTASEMTILKNAAVEWGQKTSFSAAEAGNALAELGKAGFQASEAAGALPSVLQLAEATSMGLADAATITANTMLTFGHGIQDLARDNDILTRAVNASTIDIGDLRETLKYVGPIARTTGTSLAEVSAAAAILGSNGIKGSMAGTALRETLERLVSPTKKTQEVMDALGISSFVAGGKVMNLTGVVALLEQRLPQLGGSAEQTAALMTAFGDRAGPGLSALISQGSQALVRMQTDLEASAGTAQMASNIMMSGLGGALERMRGSVETAAMSVGEAMVPAIRMGASALESFAGVMTKSIVPVFSSLPGVVQASVGGFLLLLAAVGPVMYIAGTLTTNFALLSAGMATLASTSVGSAVASTTLTAAYATQAAVTAALAPGVLALNTAMFTAGNTVTVLTARLWLLDASQKALALSTGALAAVKQGLVTVLLAAQLNVSALAARYGLLTAAQTTAAVSATRFGAAMAGVGTAASVLGVITGWVSLFAALGVALWETGKAFANLWNTIRSGQSAWAFLTAKDDTNWVRRTLGMGNSVKQLAQDFAGASETIARVSGAGPQKAMNDLGIAFTTLQSKGGVAADVIARITAEARSLQAQGAALTPALAQLLGGNAGPRADFVGQLAKIDGAVRQLTGSQREQIGAATTMGISADEVAKSLGLAEGVVRAYRSQTKEAAKTSVAAAEAIERLDQLTGRADLKAASQKMADIGRVGLGSLSNDDVLKTFDQLVQAKDIAARIAPQLVAGYAAGLTGLAGHPAIRNAAQQAGRQIIQQTFDPAVLSQQVERSLSGVMGPALTRGLTGNLPAAMLPTQSLAGWTSSMNQSLAGISFESISTKFDTFIKARGVTMRESFGTALSSLPDLLTQAFTSGGGVLDAFKGLGVQLADHITRPMIQRLAKLSGKGAIGKQTAVGVGAAGAGALGGAFGGSTGALIGSTTAGIAGAALATTFAATTGGMIALGAATLGIGAAAVGVYLLAKHFLTVSKDVKAARTDVQSFQEELWKTMTTRQQIEAQGQGWAATLITVRDAYTRLGRSALDAERITAQLLNTDKPEAARAAMVEINTVVGQFRAHLERANTAFTPLLGSAAELGRRLPESLLLSIQGLRDIGDLSAENVALFDRLAGGPDIDYKKFEEAAGRYNINPDALGIGYKQAKSNTAAQQMIDDFDLLTQGGASVGTVLHGMREEISRIVSDSIQFGTTLPENMQPWIAELERTGQLLDADGKKITDLSRLQFGNSLQTSFQNITDALNELVRTLQGPFLEALGKIPKQVGIDVQLNGIDPGDWAGGRRTPGGPVNPDDYAPTSAAGLGSAPGLETVGSAGFGGGSAPVQLVAERGGRVLAEVVMANMDDVAGLRGLRR